MISQVNCTKKISFLNGHNMKASHFVNLESQCEVSIIIQLNIGMTTRQTPPLFSFCYTNPPKSQSDLDDVRSISSYRTYLSQNSGTSSKTSIKRVNELKPKTKISIPKPSSTRPSSRRVNTETLEVNPFQPPTTKTEAFTHNENINYNQIKPTFNWGKIGLLCSMGSRKSGDAGCLCGEPCPWKVEWTKSQQKNDSIAYKRLLLLKPTHSNLSQIDLDIHRTHPQNPTFARNALFRQMLREVLISYSVYDIQLGYVQGLNMIAGVLLYHIKSAEKTFWALVEMMEYQQLRMIYIGKLEHLEIHINKIEQLISTKINDLYQHMNSLGIDCRCFMNGWLLGLMSTAIPIQEMHVVLGKFKIQGWPYMYRLVIAVLCFLKQSLMMSDDQAEFLMNMSSQNYKELGGEWEEIIKSADQLLF